MEYFGGTYSIFDLISDKRFMSGETEKSRQRRCHLKRPPRLLIGQRNHRPSEPVQERNNYFTVACFAAVVALLRMYNRKLSLHFRTIRCPVVGPFFSCYDCNCCRPHSRVPRFVCMCIFFSQALCSYLRGVLCLTAMLHASGVGDGKHGDQLQFVAQAAVGCSASKK